NIRLPSDPSATPSANVTPTKKLMRFMEAPFISQRILTQKTGSSSIVISRVTAQLEDDGLTGSNASRIRPSRPLSLVRFRITTRMPTYEEQSPRSRFGANVTSECCSEHYGRSS